MWKTPTALRVAFALAVLALLPACAAKTSSDLAVDDQEIARQIAWELRKDPRLTEIRIRCLHAVVTLEGRVQDQSAQSDALRIAGDYSRGAKVMSVLEVRPR